MAGRSFILVLALAAAAPADTLKFANTASTVEVVVTRRGVPHAGTVKKFTGTIDRPGGNFGEGRLTADLRTDSVEAANDRLTAYFRSAEVLDAQAHPRARLVTTAVRPVADDSGVTHLLTADLTLRGVTKSVTIPARVKRTPTGLTLDASVTVRRAAFGIPAGDGALGPDVTLKLTLQAGK